MLAVESVCVRVRNHQILDNVTFQLERGQLTVVAGPSGSGKTSLLGALGGGLRSTGSVQIMDERGRTPLTADSISWIFQTSRADDRALAWEIAALAQILDGQSIADAYSNVISVLDRMNMVERANTPFGRLSGGERQRVMIAQALISNKDVVVADEPTAALDRVTTQVVLEAIIDLGSDKYVILSSHDPDVWAVADLLVRLDRGVVVVGEQ